METLDKIEKESNFIFPLIYKNFYEKCEISIPKGFVGTDLFNQYKELNSWALELINEDGAENFLTDTDFVFMMHQGYMFWYFNANGEINPYVYFYEEGMLCPKKIDFLDRFLVNYPK
ncbi:SMI1/KNR4 family protein [Flavobacterium anhuiense]|uniref:SMI1/KNR4 family protein n=1 Tax=Flavobacterium anhuiense TaxID=459526 RepID=UPI000E6CF416|nr:SMI1/KNR4 family protein [Flavobacterium anhuiense]